MADEVTTFKPLGKEFQLTLEQHRPGNRIQSQVLERPLMEPTVVGQSIRTRMVVVRRTEALEG